MHYLFWGLTVTMLIAAICFAALPLRSGKSYFGRAGLIVALVFPLASFGLYALLGSPDAITAEAPAAHRVQQDATVTANKQAGRSLGTVASLLDGLKTKLEENPDNADNWMLLARSYQHLGKHTDAQRAYELAQSLGTNDPEFETWLAGAAQGPAIRGRVMLSADAKAVVRPNDTVFIFAKKFAADRMPVVALRKSAADLPIDFSLTDKEMMVPGTHLADFDELLVTARVSRSGDAADNSDGLEAWSDPVSPLNGGEVELVIATTAQSRGGDDE